MPNKQQTSDGEIRMIDEKMTRSLRIAFAAALVIALVIPVAESIFPVSTIGRLVMRSIDVAALLAISLNVANAYLLDRQLNAHHQRTLNKLRSEAKKKHQSGLE